MSDAAVELDRWWRRCCGCQSCEFRCDHYYPADKLFADEIEIATRDLKARLASAEKERGRLQHLDRMMAPHVEKLIAERDTLKAERDELRINVTAITEKVLRYDREVGELKAAAEQARLVMQAHLDRHLQYHGLSGVCGCKEWADLRAALTSAAGGRRE